jgi:hypothetical protein
MGEYVGRENGKEGEREQGVEGGERERERGGVESE